MMSENLLNAVYRNTILSPETVKTLKDSLTLYLNQLKKNKKAPKSVKGKK